MTEEKSTGKKKRIIAVTAVFVLLLFVLCGFLYFVAMIAWTFGNWNDVAWIALGIVLLCIAYAVVMRQMSRDD